MSGCISVAERSAPWPCYRGNKIVEGCTIIHPRSDERGLVVFLDEFEYPEDQWRVDYGDLSLSRLCLQVGDKGMAYVDLSHRG